ncbi:hypothetical protein M8C21_004724, partial [Ambrosia artemisiifolia]
MLQHKERAFERHQSRCQPYLHRILCLRRLHYDKFAEVMRIDDVKAIVDRKKYEEGCLKMAGSIDVKLREQNFESVESLPNDFDPTAVINDPVPPLLLL